MQLKYSNILESENAAEIRLFGEIGSKINGHEAAHEIAYLGKMYDTLHIFFNSAGGSVTEGYSIVSAILGCEAKTIGKIEGLAASMMGICAVNCDELHMADYSRLMIHMVSTENASTKADKAINELSTSLQTIIKNRTGWDDEKAARIMKAESWFNADQALAENLVDSVYKTGKKLNPSNELKATELVDFYNRAVHTENKNQNTMKKVLLTGSLIDLLSLENKAEGDEMELSEVENSFKARLKDETDKVTAAENKVTKKEDEIKTLKNTIAEKAVDSAIESGKFKKDEKENLLSIAKNNLESFEKMVGAVVPPVNNILDNLNNGGGDEKATWSLSQWEQKDPIGLQNMLKNNKAKYDKLLAAEEA